jgi:branched-chain amino acid transport system substrate-binding protein
LVFGSLVDRSVATQQARENAIQLAARQVNEEGGLSGREIGVVFCDIAPNTALDTLSRSEAAVESAEYLADVMGVPAIIGPSASTDTLDVFQSLPPNQTLVISPAATSPALTGIDVATASDEDPGLLWRTAPPDTVQGAAIARFLQKQVPPASDVWVIHEKGIYGEALTGVFLPLLQANGGSATVRQFATATERDAAVIDAGSSTAEWVLFVSSQTSDSSAFLNAAAALSGFDSKMVFLTDAAANTDLLADTTSATSIYPRVRGTKPGLPTGNVYEQFRASFNAAYSQEANDYSFVAHAYDAAWMVFLGSAWAQKNATLGGLGIARGLRHVVPTGSAVPLLPSSWSQLSEALASDESVNLTGASGSLDYDPDNEETTGPVDIWQISGTQISVLETDPGN